MKMEVKKLSIGTAQWGSSYGVSNTRGQTCSNEVSKILSLADEKGISLIDTAAAYGNAEAILGQYDLDSFSIVTKTLKIDKKTITKFDVDKLVKTFKSSLEKMNCVSCYGLLLHHKNDILKNGGEYIAEALNILKSDGYVKKIGVSIYDTKDIELVIDRLNPSIIQLPLNVFDQRVIHDGSLIEFKNNNVEIHARSIFLQGLLLMSPEKIPLFFEPWAKKLNQWREICNVSGMSYIEAALNFVIKQDLIDYCIVGVEDINQLRQCISVLNSKKIMNLDKLASTDDNLINPSNWKI